MFCQGIEKDNLIVTSLRNILFFIALSKICSQHIQFIVPSIYPRSLSGLRAVYFSTFNISCVREFLVACLPHNVPQIMALYSILCFAGLSKFVSIHFLPVPVSHLFTQAYSVGYELFPLFHSRVFFGYNFLTSSSLLTCFFHLYRSP